MISQNQTLKTVVAALSLVIFYQSQSHAESIDKHTKIINDYTTGGHRPFTVDGCSIAIEIPPSNYLTSIDRMYVDAADLDAEKSTKTKRDQWYSYEISCRNSNKCIRHEQYNSRGVLLGKYFIERWSVFHIENNHALGARISDAFVSLIKGCSKKVSHEVGVKTRESDDLCPGVYSGKSVMAPTKDILGPSGSEQAIVLGFSKSNGMATVKSVRNPNMVGEVPCSSLK